MVRQFAIALSLVAFLSSICFGQSGGRLSMFVHESQAYGLILPTRVLSDNVIAATWSADSRSVLLVQRDDRLTPASVSDMLVGKASVPGPALLKVSLWESQPDRLTDLWRAEVPFGTSVALHRVGATGYFLLNINSPDAKGLTPQVVEVNAASRVVRPLVQSGRNEGTGWVQAVEAHPDRNFAMIFRYRSNIDPSSGATGSQRTIGEWIPYVPGRGFARSNPAEAGGGYFLRSDPSAFAQVERGDVLTIFRLNAGTWMRTDARPEPIERLDGMSAGPLRLILQRNRMLALTGATSLGDGASQPPRGERTKSEGAAIVSSDADEGHLSPQGDAVLFLSQGVAMVRPVTKIPYAVYRQARDAAERAEALSNAKQIGLAALICAADYDDFVHGSEGWQERLQPYLKNRLVMTGFIYTFGGGSLSDITHPDKTELGYIVVPGGRAVVYLDGSAKIVPDP